MIKRGYKVVLHGKLKRSAIQTDKSRVFYSQSTSAKPNENCGPLTVFKTLKGAVNFHSQMQSVAFAPELSLSIYKCYYIPSEKREVWSDLSDKIAISFLERANVICIIPGSVDLADEVILGDEV